MEINTLIAILAALLLMLLGLYVFKSKDSSSSESENKKSRRRADIPNRDEDGQIIQEGPRTQRGPAGAGRRMRRRVPVQEEEPEQDVIDEPREDGEIESDEEGNLAKFSGKVGKKKLLKMEDKAEKKKQREAELLDREARKKRLEKEEQERNLQDAKEQEKEKIQLEEEQRIREEKERKEQEEYDAMKEAFIVDEEGFDEDPEEDQENLLEKFIQYIKDTKVVVLEDLAAHFQMKTDDTIDRVSTLIKEEKLTGVIDDRGKFIFISQEELEAVGKFITQRGRVSISELAENSNRLISLETKSSI